ncbi:MAG: CdaR family transcriptional regulator [Caulobacteraceae bacterium]
MNIEIIDCGKIVNRVMNILGKNINIMNEKGIIIASGDKRRIGTFHEAAKLVVESNREVIVDNDIKFRGCKKGVNLPIYHSNHILGVIGITGEPSEIKGYGIIVKELVELMIQEEERKKNEMFQAKAMMNFANELIKEQDKQNLELLKLRTHLIGFDIKVKRVIIVADICNFSKAIENGHNDQEIMVQQLKQKITDNITRLLNMEYDLVFNLYEDRFIIYKHLDGEISDFCRRTEDLLKSELGLQMYMGIGSLCSGIGDYYKSYELANRLVNIGRKTDPQKLIYNAENYKVQLLLQSIKRDDKEQYMSSLGEILSSRASGNSRELLDTAKIYFEKGMSIKDTAEALFLHRNTILYRINRLKEQYGLDITDPYTCMLLYLGIIIMNME